MLTKISAKTELKLELKTILEAHIYAILSLDLGNEVFEIYFIFFTVFR